MAHPPTRIMQGNRVRWIGVTREWLEGEYMPPPVGKEKSTQQIADELGAHYKTVWNWRQLFGIREPHAVRHSRKMSGEGNTAYKDGSSRAYHKRVLSRSGVQHACEWCGATDALHVHHRNHDITDGSLANLAWLCYHCNLLEAHVWNLVHLGRAALDIRESDGQTQLVITFGAKNVH